MVISLAKIFCFFVKFKVNPNQFSLLTYISTADPLFLGPGMVTNEKSKEAKQCQFIGLQIKEKNLI